MSQKILKEKIVLESNPFGFGVQNAPSSEKASQSSKEAPRASKKEKPMHLKADGHTYQVKYLERIVELCKKNAIEYIKMPNGTEIKLHVIPKVTKLSTKVKPVSQPHSTSASRARAAHAREIRMAQLAKRRQEELEAKEADSQSQNLEDMSEDDVLFWSSR